MHWCGWAYPEDITFLELLIPANYKISWVVNVKITNSFHLPTMILLLPVVLTTFVKFF